MTIEKQSRTIQLHIRMTKQERQRLQKRAEQFGHNASSYVRFLIRKDMESASLPFDGEKTTMTMEKVSL